MLNTSGQCRHVCFIPDDRREACSLLPLTILLARCFVSFRYRKGTMGIYRSGMNSLVNLELLERQLLKTASLQYNLHAIKFVFKMYNSVVFNIFTELYSCHHDPFQSIFITQKETPPMSLLSSPSLRSPNQPQMFCL